LKDYLNGISGEVFKVSVTLTLALDEFTLNNYG